VSEIGANSISDAAYDSSTWDGITTIAPSKNAIRDKFESLGSMSLQDSDNTNITGGSISNTDIDVNFTPSGYALTPLVSGDNEYDIISHLNGIDETLYAIEENILPDQTDQTGKYLTTDGSNASWATIDLEGEMLELALVLGGR
jgi:hypothetical protein